MSDLKRFRKVDGPWPGRGEYVRVVQDGKVTARAGCPGCGCISTMSDHTIDDQGRVAPSVGCASSVGGRPGPPVGCGYHEVGVVLEDWAP
jgi:hypothetical protein